MDPVVWVTNRAQGKTRSHPEQDEPPREEHGKVCEYQREDDMEVETDDEMPDLEPVRTTAQ